MNRSKRPVNSFFLFTFFLFSLVAHYKAQVPFELFAQQYGISTLYIIIGIGMGSLGIGLIYFLVNHAKQVHLSIAFKAHWLFILSLAILCYFTIMPYKTEAMHFIQYGIMGILCLRVLNNPVAAVHASFFLGIIDELVQYLFGSGVYFDFNDVVLNYVGSFLGVLMWISFISIEFRQGFRWMSGLNIVFGGLLFVGLLTGVVCFFNDGKCPLYLCTWGSDRLQSVDFWDYAWETPWHRIRPLPGALIIALLPLTAQQLNKLA